MRLRDRFYRIGMWACFLAGPSAGIYTIWLVYSSLTGGPVYPLLTVLRGFATVGFIFTGVILRAAIGQPVGYSGSGFVRDFWKQW